MELLEKIKAQLEAFAAKKKELIGELQTEFPKLFAPVFELNPEVEKVTFHQYTPYFNDGDECVFRVGYDDLLIKGDDEYTSDVFPKSVYSQFEKVLSQVPEEFLKGMFGDHQEVTIKRDGSVETEDYYHD